MESQTLASPKERSRPFPKFTLTLVGIFFAMLLTFVVLSQGDDFEVVFEREVPSAVAPQTLGQALDSVLAWSQWHHITVDARRLDSFGNPLPLTEQNVVPGAIVKFTVEPKQRPERRFELVGRVKAHEPGKKVHVEFVSETKPQVAKLFDRLEWEIELTPGTPHGAPQLPPDQAASGTTIRGKMTAHTATWRARLFAKVAKRILMNQVFYPNLTALAELRTPRTLEQAFPEVNR
jgi:hypothetical protein